MCLPLHRGILAFHLLTIHLHFRYNQGYLPQPIWLLDVYCPPGGGNVQSLDQCNHLGYAIGGCTHVDDIGLECTNCRNFVTCLNGDCPASDPGYCDGVAECSDGSDEPNDCPSSMYHNAHDLHVHRIFFFLNR